MKPTLPIASRTSSALVLPADSIASNTAQYLESGLQGAPNTQRAYRADLADFEAFLVSRGEVLAPATAATLADYLSAMADRGLKWATLRRRLSALVKWHELQGLDNPTLNPLVQHVLTGIKRQIRTRQRQAPAFEIGEFKRALDAIPHDRLAGWRDRALLLMGLAGAFRRSELVALNLEDLRFERDALLVDVVRSKTDQTGEGDWKALYYSPYLEYCPVRTVQHWIEQLGRTTGALFVSLRKGERLTGNRLSDKGVARITKRWLGEDYSAHSLRASFVTIAKRNGQDDLAVMRQTKHKSTEMIHRYTRIQDVTVHNAAKELGL
ncbi:Site-specific recombinase XerD [Catalinimonas alkaloidigena]|uniref:Site-specific recombinase XerD n=1 Tax=Catalinimonas alkaloidigena TaxID=1075417 RepID=A0A1G9VIS3_9BACT|nr:site-specific integrase [Catalinimonas alkaloidigena]SDM72059.1 Site-specific recombinase XerD [Catalinimonas alkaloidigena]